MRDAAAASRERRVLNLLGHRDGGWRSLKLASLLNKTKQSTRIYDASDEEN